MSFCLPLVSSPDSEFCPYTFVLDWLRYVSLTLLSKCYFFFLFCTFIVTEFNLDVHVDLVTGMIMGASASSVWYNLRVPHPTKEVPIIDYDLALLFQPMLMLGITLGVALSVVFPYWLITVLIIILFLGL